MEKIEIHFDLLKVQELLFPHVQRFFIFASSYRNLSLNINSNFGKKSGFSIFSGLDWPTKLKLCSQLEYHKG